MPVQASESGEANIIKNAAEANVINRFISLKFKITQMDLARFRPLARN
jgi:hypothetical protein